MKKNTKKWKSSKANAKRSKRVVNLNGKIYDAEFTSPPPFAVGKKTRKGSIGAGIRFEEKVGAYLRSRFGAKAITGVWVKYWDTFGNESICEMDGIVLDVYSGLIVVCECKLTHTRDAWFQLNHKYMPLMKFLFPGFRVVGLEIFKHFHSGENYPQNINFCKRIRHAQHSGNNVMRLDL